MKLKILLISLFFISNANCLHFPKNKYLLFALPLAILGLKKVLSKQNIKLIKVQEIDYVNTPH